jgi:heme/copper-type cytochrome/quinol oxidase subunit 3
MSTRPFIDVSNMVDDGFHTRSTLWWGNVGMIIIEGTMFVMVIASYFYLRGRELQWPPGQILTSNPPWTPGVVNTIIMLAALVPTAFVDHFARRMRRGPMLAGLWICVAFGLAALSVRIFEFKGLSIWWDSNAYGSIVWILLGLHTSHQVVATIEATVMAIYSSVWPLDRKRFSDVCDVSLYWYFVLLIWVPVFLTLYVVPRVI